LERFRDAIYAHSAAGSVVVIPWANRKLITPMYGDRQRFYVHNLSPKVLDSLLARHGIITVALHDRAESQHLRAKARENQELLDTLASRAEFELLFEWGTENSDRLRIWRVSAFTRNKDG
jgi:hypothetical protein